MGIVTIQFTVLTNFKFILIMKQILLLMTMIFSLFVWKGHAQFSENFEGGIPATWTTFKLLGTTPTPYVDNPATLTVTTAANVPGWVTTNQAALVCQGTVSAYVDRGNILAGNTSQAWLVSPAITVPANGRLSFNGKQTLPADFATLYKVRISTTSATDVSTFTNAIVTMTEAQLNPGPAENYNVCYTHGMGAVDDPYPTIDLSAYAGQQVYIAFIKIDRQPAAAINADRWVLDEVKVYEQCMPPTNVQVTPAADSATITWTGSASNYEVSVVPGSGAPETGTIFTSTTNSVVASPLSPSTAYTYYVRSVCPDNNSEWVGPFTFSTTQVPVILGPGGYYETFETPSFGWSFINGTQTNKWHVGTATSNGGTHSMYISNNNGVANAYTNNVGTVVHAYRDIQLPATVGEIYFSYDWKAVAESCCDYLRVWIVPSSFTPTAGTQITALAGQRIQFGANHNQQANWTTQSHIVNAAPFAGQIVRVVFEWRNDTSVGTNPPAAVDNINIMPITCSAPSNLAIANLNAGDVTFSWNAPGGTPPASYDYYFATSITAPTNATEPTGNVTGTTVNISPLAPSTTYYFWVRSNCGTDGESFWVGPLSFNTAQIPTSLDYFENFDGASPGWTLNNGTQTNKWVIGGATFNSPSQSLYISNDNGVTNNYTNSTASTVQAYKDFIIPATANQLALSYDWKANGESCCDYFRVWLVPVSFTPTPGTQITALAGQRVQIGGNHNMQTSWSTQNHIIDAVANGLAGQLVRLVFEWRNDGSVGTSPAAAIDNVNFSVITCPSPSNLALANLGVDNATITWNGIAGSYDYYLSTSITSPLPTTTPTDTVSTNQAVLNGLPDSTTFYFWVRSNCDADGVSFWVGPLSFNTPQVPASLPFFDNFDTPSGFTLNNGTQVNKWVIGGATFNSPSQSLYISNDNGTTNSYTIGTASTVHAYRDIQMPATIGQAYLSFDWKAVAESCCDYIRVWMVPVTFTPTPGTQIAAGAGRIQIGGNMNQQAAWQTFTQVFDASAYAGQIVRLVFEWRNDGSVGTQPPAAIDNVNLSAISCSAPSNLAVTSFTSYSVTYSWNPPGGAAPESYDYYFSTSPTSPNSTTEPTGNTTGTTVTIENLDLATTYYFWVRSNCGDEDGVSFWIGPVIYSTPICEIEDQCLYTFTLTDTFGDGWNGNTMTVSQNGIAVQTLTLTGGSSAIVQVPLCHGVPFTLFWNAGGSFAGEVGVSITNFLGENIYTKAPGQGSANTTLYTGIAECTPPTCPQPIDLVANGEIGSTIITLSWTPVGTETQWEVFIVDAGAPAPTATSTGIIVDTNSYDYSAVSDHLYEFYVRAICSDDDMSYWSGPNGFSIFVPPGCAQVDVVGVGVEIVNNAIVVCPDENTEVTLSADFFGIAATTSYEVESIDYSPPFPFVGGIEMPITSDDDYTASFNLPFNFCFFGESYSYCRVGDNGVITFGMPYTTTYGEYCSWVLPNQPIPNPAMAVKNSIYGVYQDLYTTNNPGPNTSINYQVLGTYPCRALVVNFNEVPAFGSSCDSPQNRMTTQIVLYEISNIIEVYVGNRSACSGWQNGLGVLGIQNAAGTLAYTPPGRNTGAWNAQNEAWRFKPNGASDVDFQWLRDNIFLTDNQEITVSLTPEEISQLQQDGTYTVTLTAQATYATCTPGEEVTTSKEVDVTFIYSFPETDPLDLTECDGLFDLTENTDHILDGVINPQVFEIHYFNSLADAQSGDLTLAIENPETYAGTDGEEIWVRIMDISNNCSEVKSFHLFYGQGEDVFADFTYDAEAYCINGSNPVVVPGQPFTTGGTFTSTPALPGLNASTGTINLVAAGIVPGVYDITYTVTGCPQVDTHTVQIEILEQQTAVLAFSYENASYCQNDPALVTNPILDPNFTNGGEFSATPAGLAIDTTTGEVNFAGSQPGTYIVTYTISGLECSDAVSHSVTLTIEPSGTPVTDFAYNSAVFCLEGANPVLVPATGFIGGGTFTVEPNTGLDVDPTTGAVNLVGATAGTYEITYTLEANSCNNGANSSTTITINDLSEPQLVFTYADTCLNATVNPMPVGAITPGGVFSSATLSVNPDSGEIDMSSVPANGTYEITYTVAVNPTTCTSANSYTATITITDSITPVTEFEYEFGTYCSNDTDATPILDSNFYMGGTFSAQPAGLSINPSTGVINIAGSTPGVYTVKYTVLADTATCREESIKEVTVTIFGEFMVAVSDECIGTNYWLHSEPVDNSFNPTTATYVWTIDGIEVGYEANLNITAYLNGANIPAGGLVVTVTVNDGCESSAQFTVTSTSCMVQKGISPNSDSANNTFDLTGMGVKKLTIYNRYGKEVYAKSNYVNEWNGVDKSGNELPDGTYFYVINKNTGENITGWIYINRKY